MGFWNRLFKGKVFDDKQMSSMACELAVCGEKYLLSEFELRYVSNDAEHQYFEMCAVIEEPVRQAVENWITSSSRKENGWVKFYENSDVLDQGALFELDFHEAGCVRYRRNIQMSQPVTTLVMTFSSIKMGGEGMAFK